MSTLTDQFSAARTAQVEAQITFFKEFTSKAVESTGKLIALNLAVTRASVEKSTTAMGQLLTVKDPRDLFALTAQTQSGFDSMLAYGRALAGIASGAAFPVTAPAAPAAPAPQLAAPQPAAFTPEVAAEPTAEPLPAAAPRPIARAASKAVKSSAAKPAAAPVEPAPKKVVVSGLKAVEASPPLAPVSGTPVIEAKPQQQQELLPPKPKKKK